MEKLENGVERFAFSTTPIADNKIEHQHASHLAQTVPVATKKNSLSEIFVTQQHVIQLLEESGGEITQEIEEALNFVELHKPQKIDGCAYFLDALKHSTAFLKKKEEEFRAVRKGCEAVQERMKTRIKEGMTQVGEQVAMGNDYRFTLSTRKDPKITVDETELPASYCTIIQTYVPNREKIAEALNNGVEVPGAKFESIQVLTRSINTPNKSFSKKDVK